MIDVGKEKKLKLCSFLPFPRIINESSIELFLLSDRFECGYDKIIMMTTTTRKGGEKKKKMNRFLIQCLSHFHVK